MAEDFKIANPQVVKDTSYRNPYVVVDGNSGETLADANGYGFRTREKAEKAWEYINSPAYGQKKAKKAEAQRWKKAKDKKLKEKQQKLRAKKAEQDAVLVKKVIADRVEKQQEERGKSMNISELKKMLQPFGIKVREQDTTTQIVKFSDIICYIGETNELSIHCNRKFAQLVGKDRAKVENILIEYATTPLEDRNGYVVRDYLVPLYVGRGTTIFLADDGQASYAWPHELKKNENHSIDLNGSSANRSLKDLPELKFTNRQLDIVKNEADPATAKLIDQNKILIFNHSQHGGY